MAATKPGSTEHKENSDEVHEENGSEGEEPEELWDLKMVLPVEQIRKSTNRCGTAGCDLIPCCIWSSSLDPETPWYCCLDCQANGFDGWPEKKEELPIKVLKDDLREAMLDKCTRLDDPVMPDLPSGTAASGEKATTEEDKSSDDAADVDADDGSSSNDEGDGEEVWELKKVFSVKELKKSKPTMCSHCGTDEECDLVACSVWVSSLDGNWFSCLDHQENDYSGWPTEEKELPMKFLTEENRQVIAEKCSAQENPAMPSNLPTSMPLLVTAAAADKDGNFSAITPPPSHNNAVADGQANVVVGAGRAKGGKKKKGVVTPMPPGAATKKPAVVAKKPSAAMMQKLTETRQRWQADAERLGGPDARIVVSKPEAKKLIFQMLLDNFRPMNTNGAFQALKGIVPPPTLRTCLDDMVDKFTGNPFADDDSDDEDGKSSKKKNTKKSGDEWAGSLRLKEGRNLNNNLYYVDHKKLANNGNGMIPEVRNDLLSNLQGAKAEFDQLSLTLKKITAEAAQLVSEPKNEELTLEGADLEKKMREMKDSLEAASAHSSNEARSKQIKKGIENMGKTWRKRKRQCIEFISMMDESTEGAISLKKCLNGACPLDIESDDACIKATIAFASRKRPRVSLAGRGGLKGGTKGSELGGLRPDENFVGVKLGSSNKIIRIFAEL